MIEHTYGPTPEETKWLDGPKLAGWLSERLQQRRREAPITKENASHDSMVLGRLIRRWAEGQEANVYTVDRWLIWLGLHLSDLPDSLFLTRRREG